jgi:hypothetical protein
MRLRARRWLRISAGLLLAAACGPSPEHQRADREVVQQALAAYLPRLAEAYASGDAEKLRGLAVAKEIATVHKSIADLANQGLSFRPRLKHITVESARLWRGVNAYATTVEVWDIDKAVLGSDRILSQVRDEPHRVRYQLKRYEGTWQVLYREVERRSG